VLKLGFIENIKEHALQVVQRSPVYDWFLSQQECARFVVDLSDNWPGDSGRGRWFCNNALDCKGALWQAQDSLWDEDIPFEKHAEHLQSFDWLRDLKALGGDMGRLKARDSVRSWIERHPKYNRFAWRSDLLGARITNWIKLYSFFGASADDHFQDLFFNSLNKQFKHLGACLPENYYSFEHLHALIGYIYGGIALQSQETKLEKGLSLLDEALPKLILSDGGFVTRSPQDLVEALKIILDLKTALKSANYPLPAAIEHALDRGIPALRFFRHNDNKLALFQNTQEGNEASLGLVITRGGVRGKTWNSLPVTGYERLNLGKAVAILDTGKAPHSADTRGLHASPLAFEFSYGKDRIFSNCGAHPTDKNWQYALRSTPAHTALTVDHRNAFEIKENNYIGRMALETKVHREDIKQGTLVSASHDGYYTVNGLIHHRSLFLDQTGDDLRGEDTLTQTIETEYSHDFAIRFHLHPTVKASLVNNGTEVLVKTRTGIGWRFFTKGAILTVEDSIYLGDGCNPRKTQQIVLTGRTKSNVKETTVKWALQREG
tara:strand:- start:2187 stop:3827 length:1641 start_codon:yes stop_codon:yes gene_type:complete